MRFLLLLLALYSASAIPARAAEPLKMVVILRGWQIYLFRGNEKIARYGFQSGPYADNPCRMALFADVCPEKPFRKYGPLPGESTLLFTRERHRVSYMKKDIHYVTAFKDTLIYAVDLTAPGNKDRTIEAGRTYTNGDIKLSWDDAKDLYSRLRTEDPKRVVVEVMLKAPRNGF